MTHGLVLAQRLGLALLGGYFVSEGLAAMGALALAGVMPRSEAGVLMAMLAFVIYLGVLIWAFAEPRLRRLWLVLGGGAVVAQGVPSGATLLVTG